MRTLIAMLSKKDQNVIPKLIPTLKNVPKTEKASFGMVIPFGLAQTKTAVALDSKKTRSNSAVGYIISGSPSNPPIVKKLEEAYFIFEGRAFTTNPKTATEEIIRKELNEKGTQSAESILKEIEGEYALIICQPKGFVAARDPIGVQPLYYGETTEIAALASNRTPLWELGIEKPFSFPPGHVATVTRSGFSFKPIRVLEFSKPKVISMTEASATLQKLLRKSVLERISGQKEVAVAFSGGLDSSVVAYLTKQTGTGIQLIHVSLEGQPETEEAKRAAEAMGLPLQVHLYTELDIERDISKVLDLVEEPDPIKAAVGVPFFWNAQKASEQGFHSMLAGQGADELFGGYQRYVNEYVAHGEEAVRQTMFKDVAAIHESNIERDEKICNYFNVELRLPFGSFSVAEFAMSLPTGLKFEKRNDSLRKLVLRMAAKNMGIPEDIADRPKKAVQYSTGINNALKKIAKKHKLPLAKYVNQLFQEIRCKKTKIN